MVTRCSDCDKAWRETRSGRVEVSPERLAAHECDCEISDVRDGPARITKVVPPKIRRHVLDRDGHRCRVPGCSSVGFLHVHHEGGREVVGHDPDVMPAMCDEHHLQRHRDLLSVREDAEVGFRFSRKDGTELTGTPEEVAAPPASLPPPAVTRSCERSADPADASSSPPPGAEEIEEDARRALRKLGLRPPECESAVSSGRAALLARGEAVTLESLLHEALIALPGPHGSRPRAPDL